MKRRLQVLALCAAALLTVRMMAQDNGGAGGDASGGSDASGGATSSGASGSGGGGSTSGGGTEGTPLPSGGTGDQNGTGMGDQNGGGTNTTPGNGAGGLFGPGTGTEGTEGGSTIVPPTAPALPPWEVTPTPGTTTPAPSPAPNASPSGGASGASQEAPVTLSLPGGYGTVGQSFTLGSGRLAKPPITFTLTTSQGYDSNIFNTDSQQPPVSTPVPFPTPPLEQRLIGFRIAPPILIPIYQTFRPKAGPTPSIPPSAQPAQVIGSPVSTLTLGIQVQEGTPRTILEMDGSVGLQNYWNQPGGTTDYTGGFDMSFIHRLTPKATISMQVTTTYQNTPNFALVNAPTNPSNSSTSYLNGDAKIDFSYLWSNRISTVTSYDLNANLLQSNASSNLYVSTFGTQFRYAVSARNTLTAELREAYGVYPSNSPADTNSTFYLVGVDTHLSAKLENTISGGLESYSFSNGGGSQLLPYVETATSLVMPRGASLTWTNMYGAQQSGSPVLDVTSYRTSLNWSEPLSTKLVASMSLAYNYLETKDTQNSAGSSNETQLQISLSLGYTVTPRLSLSLSYTYIDLLTTQAYSSYQRSQIFFGGTYTFE